MDDGQPKADELAAVYFRAEDLARRTVEYHRVREAEHRSRERFGRRFTPFPWSEAAAAVLSDEALEDEATVVALIRELGRQGCSEVALAALDMVVARGSPAASKAMFDAAILVCATEYQDQRCVEQYQRMQSLGLPPDLATVNLVLTGLCCRGRLARAVELLGEMRTQLGLRPNSYTVLMVLQACNYKRRGAYREAIDAVQALEAGGRTANEEVIEALLQVCEAAMHQAPTFEAAVAVFQALTELHLADSTRVYNGLLGAAGRAGRWREAQALYAQMQEDDVPASLETHTALIQACVVGRALDHALDIFEHLVAGRSAHEAVPASIATYNHLIHACHQAGMLEKALEIASWVQKTGVEFDDETYGELMATIDVAQLWDDKAMKQARQRHRAVLPRHLRPAPYDAMRVMYLDHLEVLQQEELLAMEKLGGQGSWAPKSLTRGSTAAAGANGRSGTSPTTPALTSSVCSSSRSLARGAPSIAAFSAIGGYSGYVAGGGGVGGGGSALAAAGGAGSGWGGYDTASASAVASGRDSAASMAPSAASAGGGPLPATSTSPVERSQGSSRSPSPQQQARAASVRQLLKTLSTRPLPVLGGGAAAAGAMSFRASSASVGGPPAAPTGFHEPPTWAQLQTMDAATAGPGGTPFSAGVGGWAGPDGAGGAAGPEAAAGGSGGGGAATAATLNLAVEPANLFGQSSAASLGATSTPRRISVRGLPPSGGPGPGAGGGGPGPGAGLRIGLPSPPALGSVLGLGPSPGVGSLPPLSDPTSPGLGSAGVGSLPSSPRTLPGGPGAPGLAAGRQRPARSSAAARGPAAGGGGGGGVGPSGGWVGAMAGGSGGMGSSEPSGLLPGGSGELLGSPLPAIPAGSGLASSRRHGVAPLSAGAGKPVVAAAIAGAGF